MNTDEGYNIYLGAIELMRETTHLPIEHMTRQEFARAAVESDFVHRSIIDLDAFEEAFGA